MTNTAHELGTPKLRPVWSNIAVAAVFALAVFGLTLSLLWWGIDSTSPGPVSGPVPTPTPSGVATQPGVSTATRLDMVKIALTVVAGIGGLVALVVAYRRQKVTEAADRHQREVAADTKHDLAERRITELYTKAVEQLGNSQAPVRLGGLYALERLAQNNIAHRQRQTVIDVVCAYLRMPFAPPAAKPAPGTAAVPSDEAAGTANMAADQPSPAAAADDKAEQRRRQEELQVRLTAQGILTRHLTRPVHLSADWDAAVFVANIDNLFWPGCSLNLTNAHLTDFRFQLGHVTDATFTNATFNGYARFDDATFTRNTWFGEAIFGGYTAFDGATFLGIVDFDRATFGGHAGFAGTTFTGYATFTWTNFGATVGFGQATFDSGIALTDARVLRAAERVWPAGWIVAPDRDDPGRGRLVQEPG